MKAVFLDKDGTLIENVPYNVRPELIRLLPGVAEGLRALHAAGFRLIVVSNQSGVARGYFPETALIGVRDRLCELLAPADVPLTGFHYCPHHAGGSVAEFAFDCTCRKPQPGLIRLAASEHRIDLASSWMVGDILDDVEAGRRAGCRTVLIASAAPAETSPWRLPDHTAPDLEAAARFILAEATTVAPG